MPDIQLRFHKDMLVLSGGLDAVLARQGVDVQRDREFLNLIEPDSVREALRLESLAGAQCLVTNTAGITTARLTHARMEDRAPELATAACAVVASLTPQHLLFEIGPTGLPLDPSSQASLKQNRDQYAAAVRACDTQGIDALFLNGFTRTADMRCALMGARLVSSTPIVASLRLDAAGKLAGCNETLAEALAVMAEYEADVVGFSSAAPQEVVVGVARQARTHTALPLLVQLEVTKNAPRQQAPTPENPYYCPDTMVAAATALRGVGVQFLRACGQSTPAYTGALVAASAGFDVCTVTG
ncbi:MAG: homocysteine S-methyltransferase family protein [Raoultibacter sp.]